MAVERLGGAVGEWLGSDEFDISDGNELYPYFKEHMCFELLTAGERSSGFAQCCEFGFVKARSPAGVQIKRTIKA